MEALTTEKPTQAKSGPVQGRVGEAATSAHGAVDTVAGAAGTAVNAANNAIDNATTWGHQAINKAQEAVEPAERWVNEKTRALLTAPKNAAADARQYIISHPWQSVGIALIAGILWGRRTR